jgi:hypothetical protein
MSAYTQRRDEIKRQKKLFLASPDDWDKKYDDLKFIYGVGESTIRKWKREHGMAINPRFLPITKEIKEKVIMHEQFGVKGERAPCPLEEFRQILKDEGIHVGRTWLGNQRQSRGVQRVARKVHKSCRIKWQPSPADNRMYRLCGKMNTWKRPEGMDAHLEHLREIS